MRILVAEADAALGAFLRHGFEAEHHAVELTADVAATKDLVRQHEFDAAIFDLHQPQPEDLDVLGSVRASRRDLPVVILAGRTSSEDRVHIFEAGADDLLLKPFAFAELSARLRALLRRGSRAADVVFRVDDLELNRVERTVRRAGRDIELTPKEFALLEYLMRQSGHCVTRAQIIQHVWHLSFDTMTNVVEVYINYLRKKVDAACHRKLIRTVRGVGYQLERESARAAGA